LCAANGVTQAKVFQTREPADPFFNQGLNASHMPYCKREKLQQDARIRTFEELEALLEDRIMAIESPSPCFA